MRKKIKLVLLFSIFSFNIFLSYANSLEFITVGDLTCEYLSNPIGIGTLKPRLSWKLSSGIPNQFQSAYQILVASSPELLKENTADLWNSNKVHSDQSIHVRYMGKKLKSRDRCWWKVRVWSKDGPISDWSNTAYFEVGLIHPQDWKGEWIKSSIDFRDIFHPSPIFRREFILDKEVKTARLYISSYGLYQAEINGIRVGNRLFTPGWTSFENRVQYQAYDVTHMLNADGNAIGVTLGDGWYRAFKPNDHEIADFGTKSLDVIVQLEITFTDNSKMDICSDEKWKSSTGPIMSSSIYNGEIYDARYEKPGWNMFDYNDLNWSNVEIVKHNKSQLVWTQSPPVRKIQEIIPEKIFYTPHGDTVIDMGQNMVGWVQLKVKAPEGTVLRVRHAEALDKDGNFYIKNLRKAKQENIYICKGSGSVEIYEPSFSYQGFRYVAISGYPSELDIEKFTGIVIHSDLENTGKFKCNDSLINQLQHNILWSQKGNFLDVPTDCPQRDERLGWTGDVQVFAQTACFNMNCAAFFTKWLKDLAADQRENGTVPHVIPDVLNRGASHGWQDAAVIVPWLIYRYYGDKQILEDQYNSMKSLVEFMRNEAGNQYIWIPKNYQLGDWLAFSTNRSDYPGATTDKDLLANAYFYHSTDLLARASEVLNKDEEARFYGELSEKIKTAFASEYITPNGRLSSNTQTAYSVCLSFGLIPDDMKQHAANRLHEDVNKFKHITTGFLGTPEICHVLSSYGYIEDAYFLLYRKEYPSWLYPVTKNATTIWERWDGIRTDGSFQDTGMNSFNHYAYGAVGDWLYRKVAGIDLDPDVPGFKSIILKPQPGGEMNDVFASYISPYGKIISEWKIVNEKFNYLVSIPVNTTCKVYIPFTSGDLSLDGVRVDCKDIYEGPGLKYYVVEKGSGTYTFTTIFQNMTDDDRILN